MKLNLRSIDLNLLPIFEAVMETRQYSKAADRLGMSQPAMSAAIQRLRNTLNDPLFIRTSKGVIPTPKADILYNDIRGALSQLRQGLSQQKGFDPSAQPHDFRILSGDYFEFVLLPQLIEEVESHDFQIRFNLKPILEGSATQLIHAQADVMLDAFPIDDERIHCEVVTQETLVVVASKKHSWIKESPTIREFFKATHAVLPHRGRLLPLDKIIDTSQMPERKIGVQVTQYISLLAAVSRSEYIATVPKHLASRYADSLGLAVYDFPIDIPPINIYMMWSKVFDHDPANQWLLNQLRAVIKTIMKEESLTAN
ncbi:MAG TPA: LysR family transcriptional regulator [Oceanospirillales bacterium]|jgi:DNA-binding transcriptional LysR family regulator|nr:LysR family transcriptional regulator [Oleispira sp.]HCM06467.1 LysR family transcriptional regulator [Oceanospirillales bacterium]|tara:strand:+ start:2725 stop:3660 length:936 start_codon:yes stop_codon:yes gene_type:complete